MKILVTGGLGFIGTNFIRFWRKKYPQSTIINLDKITYAANPENLKDFSQDSKYQFIKEDIVNPNFTNRLPSLIDLIVHFAAESHVDRSINDPSLFVKTNVLGTYNLLNFAKNNGNIRFHHISTDEVFGSLPLNSSNQFSESTPYDPSSPYSASKAASDHLVRSFGKTFGLPVTITNCSNNYGPYQHPEKFIPRLITNLLENQKIPVYGQGLNFRDWLYVDDHCSAISAVINRGKIGDTYCIGGLYQSTKNIDLVKKIINLMGKDMSQIEYVADRPAHDNYSVDWSKIKNDLGWQPQETLDTGLKKTIEWYQTHQKWWQDSKKEAEKFYKNLAKQSKI